MAIIEKVLAFGSTCKQMNRKCLVGCEAIEKEKERKQTHGRLSPFHLYMNLCVVVVVVVLYFQRKYQIR